MRFQDLFHSPPGVLFAFPSRYWFTIGRLRVFSLGGWSPHIQTGFHVSRPTCRKLSSTFHVSHTGLSPTMAGFSKPLCYVECYILQAAPGSLATTSGISVDFCSYGYLDVSVHHVRSLCPMYSDTSTLAGGFPHSDIFGSMLICQLPEAFRRLSRLSSLVIAKASTTCTYSLDSITLSLPADMTGKTVIKSTFVQYPVRTQFAQNIGRYNLTHMFSNIFHLSGAWPLIA